VLRYEPYYKLAQGLLGLAVEKGSLPLDRALNVTLFAGGREKALRALGELGAEVMGEEQTPFGPMLTVRPHPESLGALAQLAEVQRIEYANARTLLNDLTRVRQQVSADTVAATNYLNLSGRGVTLNLNDTGVDKDHSDLRGRLSSADLASLVDLDGHGTHVAGTIIGNGTNSLSALDGSGNPPSGSVLGASFRGMAPEASLFVLPVDLKVGPLLSDRYLQETAASNNFVVLGRTNALISNNSWAYVNAFEYNFASASYDAAVRDGLSACPVRSRSCMCLRRATAALATTTARGASRTAFRRRRMLRTLSRLVRSNSCGTLPTRFTRPMSSTAQTSSSPTRPTSDLRTAIT